MYRERVIEKFVPYDAMGEVEWRILESQEKNERRVGSIIAGLADRLNRLIDVKLKEAGHHR